MFSHTYFESSWPSRLEIVTVNHRTTQKATVYDSMPYGYGIRAYPTDIPSSVCTR